MATRYQQLLDQYLAVDPLTNPSLTDTSSMPETKAAAVERATAEKKREMGPDGYALAAMRNSGAGQASASQMDRDFISLSPNEFRVKYGNEVGQRYSQAFADGDSSRRNDLQSERSGMQILGDAVNTALATPVTLASSIVAGVEGLVNPELGVTGAKETERFQNWAQSFQSEPMQAARRAYSTDTALAAKDTAQQQKIDDAVYGEGVGGAIRIASDLVDGVAVAAKNPAMALDTVANAGGSLVAGGVIAGGLKKIGSGLLKAATKTGVLAEGGAIASKVASLGSKAAMPTSMVGMEAGAAYQQTAQTAYDELIAQGVPHEEAVQRANSAALEAAGVQGAITAAIMPLTGGAHFERAPFRVSSLGSAARRAAGEMIEEGIQEGSAQFSQNLGIQDYVDPDQALTDGIGSAAALGAIGGVGAAGATQAPGMALRGTIETAKLPFKALSKGLTYLGDRVDARNQKVQDDLLAGLYDQANAASNEASAEAIDTIDKAPWAEDAKVKAKQWVGDTLNRLQATFAMQSVAQAVTKVGGSMKDKLDAAIQLNDMVRQSQAAQDETTPDGMQNSTIQKIKDVVANAAQSEAVQASLERGKTLFGKAAGTINANARTALAKVKGVQTPDFADLQNQAQMVSGLAENAPEGLDPIVADQILYHDGNGSINLTPAQRATIRGASAMAKAAQEGAKLASQYGLPNAEAVSKEVLTEAPKQGSKLSLKGHLETVRTAYNAGDFEGAAKALTDLRHFAKHLNNKVVSFNDALVGGNTNSENPLTFSQHIGNGVFRPTGQTYISPRSAGSVKLAQHVAIQAATVASAVNNLMDAFPDIVADGVEHIQPAILDASLDGPPETVAKNYKAKPQEVPSVETKSEVSEVVEPKPEAEPSTNADQLDSEQVETIEPVAEKPQVEEAVDEPAPVEDGAAQAENENTTEPSVASEANDTVETVGDTAPVPAQSLIGGEKNRVLSAFKAPKTSKARTAESQTPLQDVKDALTDEASLRETAGELNRRFSAPVAQAYAQYLAIGDLLLSKLNDRLQDYLSGRLKRGINLEDAVGFTEGGALNLMIENEDGSYSYDPSLVQGATLAALQWYLKMNSRGTPLDDDGVRQMFGLDSTMPIPAGLAEALSSGLSNADMARSLAREIGRFWGRDTNPNAPENHAQSVLEGIAKELLTVMTDPDLIQIGNSKVPLIETIPVDIRAISTRENVDTVNRYRPTSLKDDAGERKSLVSPENPVRQFPNAIETAVLVEPEEISFLGSPPKDVAKTQLRSDVPVTEEQQEAARKEQAIPHYLNMPFVETITNMGEALVLRLFGGGPITDTLNENHKRSLEGQNLTIQSALRSIQELVTEAQSKAEMDGKEIDDLPIHYAYAFTVVNRLQMLGLNNPQSSKLMREAVLPTWDTIDMTLPENRIKFSLGMAQALGVKVHQISTKHMLSELTDKLAGFEQTLKLLSEKTEGFSEADIDMMKVEGVDSPVALHALMEFARLQKTEDRSTFRTALYFEADGVTNGVVNAMSLFTSGDFTDTWLSNMERGGLWIGEQVLSLAGLRGRDGDSKADLYGVAASKTARNVWGLRKQYQGSNVNEQIGAVLEFLNEFVPGVIYDGETGSLTVDRGAVKNPLTITIYGSGSNGIAGNILDEALTNLYARFSEAAARKKAEPGISVGQALFGGDAQTADLKYAKFQETMGFLVGGRLFSQPMPGGTILDVGTGSNKNALIGKDFTGYTVSKEARQIMQDNILHAFVEPMVRGITWTVGKDLVSTMKVIKTQTQTWSLIGQFLYQNEYEAALKAKREANPEMNSYDLLTKAEADAIFEKVRANLPFFSTGSQNFAFGGQQRLDFPFFTSKNGKPLELEFSRNLDGGMKTPAYGWMPGDAGVSGQPNMTIGSGDGMAILNLILNETTPEKRLQIFDGVHSSVSELDKMGLATNQAVFDSWQKNPLDALAKAFEGFVKQADVSSLNEAQRKAIGKSLLGDWEGVPTDKEILDGLKGLAQIGTSKAKGVSQRQAVLSKLQLSVDQMAGAANPFSQQGIILSGSSEEKAAQLNRLMGQVEQVEETTGAASVVSVAAPMVAGLTEKAINKLTSDKLTRALLREVVRSGKLSNYEIHTGSRADLLTKAVDMGISIPASRQSTFMGFMHSLDGAQHIFAVDGNPETILHEMIHAATYVTLQSYYNNELVGPEISEAIQRLEGLMAQFREANLDGEAYQNALDEMDRQQELGNRAAELNEFMAWSLANQDLAEQLQSPKVESKFLMLARKAVSELKKLLWGGKRSAAVKDDLFSNIRFNTSILMRAPNTAGNLVGSSTLFHDQSFGDDPRIRNLLGRIKSKVADYVTGDQITTALRAGETKRATIRAASVANLFSDAGFNFTMQERMAFLHMVGIMSTAAQLDGNTTSRMQDLYQHVIKQLSVDDFLRNPNENDPADSDQANRKFNLLTGKFVAKVDGMDRSAILPAFIALATTNAEFRQIISKMEMPKGQYASWTSVDNILDNVGEMGMDAVGRAMSGEGLGTKKVQDALDNLVEQMLDTEADSQLFIEKFTNPLGSGIDRVNDIVKGAFSRLGEAAQRNVDAKRSKGAGKLEMRLAESLNTIAGLLHEPTGHEASMRLISNANQSDRVPTPLFDLLNDLVGRTTENAGVYDLIKLARSWISGLRQQYVEELPKIIDGKFQRNLSDNEKTAMHKGLAQTGMASLLSSLKIDEILDLVKSPSKREAKMKELRATIRDLSPGDAAMIFTKVEQLADYITTKKTGSNLLRNADAIAALLGEGVNDPVTSPEMVEAIRHLVSLEALTRQSVPVLNHLEVLAQNEAEGLNFMLNLLRGKDEIDAAKATGNAKFNHYHGYVPSSYADSVSLIVAHDSEAKGLLEKGYTRLGALKGSEADPSAKGRSYWYAPVSGRAPFSQGITQNVQQTVAGVDKHTGMTLGLTGGAITDAKFVAKIAQSGTKESYGSALLPLYNEGGKLIGYERQVDPALVEHRLKPDTDIAKMMGIRAGRQAEEANAMALNTVLVDKLREMWDRDRKSRAGEYVDLLASEDPVHKDAMGIMSKEMRALIEMRFPEGFMVRKDMINDAIGYRNASVGDAWTGTSRWSEETQRHVRQMLKGMFGNKAYVYATKAEKFWQNAIVQDIRTMIVIRSVIVPAANAASNVYQLIGRGVPMVQIFRNIPKKTAEIEGWHKSRIRQIEAEAELLATSDPLVQKRLEAEIKTITDDHKRLSIWPLLERGEFSSISDAGSREDVLLTEGRLSDYIETVVDKLPAGVKTLGKYAIISKDTALFRALQKTVDYGDFVAKAILYDDLTKRQGMSKADALAQITEEFVNYDRLPGRDRQYLESIGLLWFWNFKVRSAKVAMSMIRNNPVHGLISANLPMPISGIGLPIEDNLWMSLFDGRALNSVGFHMGFRAPGLLPIGNLFG